MNVWKNVYSCISWINTSRMVSNSAKTKLLNRPLTPISNETYHLYWLCFWIEYDELSTCGSNHAVFNAVMHRHWEIIVCNVVLVLAIIDNIFKTMDATLPTVSNYIFFWSTYETRSL